MFGAIFLVLFNAVFVIFGVINVVRGYPIGYVNIIVNGFCFGWSLGMLQDEIAMRRQQRETRRLLEKYGLTK